MAPGAPVQAPPPPDATAVRWSPAMLQSLRLQAFEQLVAQLARQVQASPNAPPAQWPSDGVSEALGRLLQALLEQVATQQGRPLQLLAAQPGSAALMQALAAAAKGEDRGAGEGKAPTPAPAPSPAQGPAPASASARPVPQPGAALAPLDTAAAKAAVAAWLQSAAAPAQGLPGAANASAPQALPAPLAPPATAGTAPPAAASAPAAPQSAALPSQAAQPSQALPPLQNWWVQQGTLMTPQGERGFMLSLQVPQAWAQAQGAALALPGAAAAGVGAGVGAGAGAVGLAGALPPGLSTVPGALGAPAAAVGWRLPLDVPLQALASGPVAVVLQPRDEPWLRTSALLLLELQPARQAAQGVPAGPFTALPPAMAQEMQQLLQNRGDPWLQMAVAQNSGALPRERSGHQSHLCTTAGCQYEGRSPCVQPFCSEMNRLWGVARAERRL